MPIVEDRREPVIAALAMERVPALARAGVKTVVHGPITFTPDANPLIGPAFGLGNAWLLTGSSMGVMEGGGAGRFLADWMVDGTPPMGALAVDPRRFGAWAAERDHHLWPGLSVSGVGCAPKKIARAPGEARAPGYRFAKRKD